MMDFTVICFDQTGTEVDKITCSTRTDVENHVVQILRGFEKSLDDATIGIYVRKNY